MSTKNLLRIDATKIVGNSRVNSLLDIVKFLNALTDVLKRKFHPGPLDNAEWKNGVQELPNVADSSDSDMRDVVIAIPPGRIDDATYSAVGKKCRNDIQHFPVSIKLGHRNVVATARSRRVNRTFSVKKASDVGPIHTRSVSHCVYQL